MTDSNQAVTDTTSYDAWGNVLSSTGTTVNPYKYVGSLGYYADSDSGLMLLGARYYGAGVGRFWSVDPIRDDSNWYIYPANNPISFVDPSGMTRKPEKGLTYPLTAPYTRPPWKEEDWKITHYGPREDGPQREGQSINIPGVNLKVGYYMECYHFKKAIWEVEFCKTTTIPGIGPPGRAHGTKVTECVRLRCSGWVEVCVFYAEGTRKEVYRSTTIKGGQCVKIAYKKFET